jgi:glyoxalase family protein
MSNRGFIRGTHHLTFCVGGAQEDYDFHVRLLGLKSVKKTVLFDGEIPIYHLYYGNRLGDTSTLLTAFPYRQAGWMGKRGTNQLKTLNLSVPVDSIAFWSDRLDQFGVEHERSGLFGTERLHFKHPCGIDYTLVGDPDPD